MGVHGEPSTWVHTRSLRGSAWVCAGRSPRGSTVQGIRICTFGAESKRQYSIKTVSAGREERDFKAETCASKSKERGGQGSWCGKPRKVKEPGEGCDLKLPPVGLWV